MKIILLLSLLLLTCCTSKVPSQSAIDSVIDDPATFSLGEEKLLQHHERAKAQWIDSSGNVVKSYSHSERKLGALSYLPLFSFLLPRNYENYEIIITYRNAAIVDVQRFHGIITLESESDCNEAIFTCVTKVK